MIADYYAEHLYTLTFARSKLELNSGLRNLMLDYVLYIWAHTTASFQKKIILGSGY